MVEEILQNPIQLIAIYLLVINGVAFFLYGIDKSMAQSGSWRVPEKVLWGVALIGGSLGALAGMKFFRHKTKKLSFQFVLALIILLQAAILFLIFGDVESYLK